jgi:ribosomal protein S18 acetylase RimI-like enzyme
VERPVTGPHLRLYEPHDLEALYEICLKTGDAGKDATPIVADPKLFGEIFAAPYGVLEPEHAIVLDDGEGRAVGYVLGALDTAAFEARLEAEWWPALRQRHPLGTGAVPMDELLVAIFHHPSTTEPDLLVDYPSHLHIDLLPEAQGQGWGRRMMATVLNRLAVDGSRGAHLGVNVRNRQALGFYEHLGLDKLVDQPGITRFGIRLTTD